MENLRLEQLKKETISQLQSFAIDEVRDYLKDTTVAKRLLETRIAAARAVLKMKLLETSK